MSYLNPVQQDRLAALLAALIDQQAARVLVDPQRRATGFWFGGGNTVQDTDGALWVCGRYRNFGDSRTGLAAGERGLECALFTSRDGGETFQKAKSWSKADLSYPGHEVLSIEGTALHRRTDGTWELFISTETRGSRRPSETRHRGLVHRPAERADACRAGRQQHLAGTGRV